MGVTEERVEVDDLSLKLSLTLLEAVAVEAWLQVRLAAEEVGGVVYSRRWNSWGGLTLWLEELPKILLSIVSRKLFNSGLAIGKCL